MTNYQPLSAFLGSQRLSRLTLTFKEVEDILGQPLPPSARKHQPWWANTDSHSQAKCWLKLGWKSEQITLSGEKVTFVRNGSPIASSPFSGVPSSPNIGVEESRKAFEPALQAPKYEKVYIDLSDLTVAARNHLDMVCKDYGLDQTRAVLAILNAAGRRAVVDWFVANAPKTTSNSVDLIREDRDAR